MTAPPLFATADQLAETGEKIYRERWQDQLEPAENGKFAVIDVASGEAVVAEEAHEALRQALAANPGSLFHLVRIGSSEIGRIGFSASNVSSQRLHRP
jgi:hypothetical protein